MSDKGRAIALVLPTGTLEFIKRNPRLARAVATAVSSAFEMQVEPQAVAQLLGREDIVQELVDNLENGTKEELLDFLEAVKKAVDAPVDLGEQDVESLREIEKKLGKDKFAYTEVDTPETKEGLQDICYN